MKKSVKSELILETAKGLKVDDGFRRLTKKYRSGITETYFKILTEECSKRAGREIGNYYSYSFDDLLFFDYESKNDLINRIKNAILFLLKINGIKIKRVLVVGLGNEKYACDSLGKRVVEKILITKPYLERDFFSSKKMKEVYAISLGVYGTTGLESSDTIKSICEMIKPDLVIAIDSLVASDAKFLAKSVQISDTKLSPGGGVGNNRQEISEAVLKTKVIAIGVPLVINFGGDVGDLIVTPKDVETKVLAISKIIAKAINLSFSKLTEKEYLDLTN